MANEIQKVDPAVVEALLLQSDGAKTPSVLAMAKEICGKEGISLQGLTILGGKPYINVVGLDQKIESLCREKNWVKCGTELRFISEESDVQTKVYRCGFYATISFFDLDNYIKALGKVTGAGPISEGVLSELRKQFIYAYSDEGWAGDASVKMSTMKNRDFLRMMASRRATNRAKRAATGCGLTSVDEMEVEGPSGDAKGVTLDAEAVAAVKASQPAAKPQERLSYKARWRDKDVLEVPAVPQAVEEQTKFRDLCIKSGKLWLTFPACVADLQALFEEFGYELVVPPAPNAGAVVPPTAAPAAVDEEIGS